MPRVRRLVAASGHTIVESNSILRFLKLLRNKPRFAAPPPSYLNVEFIDVVRQAVHSRIGSI